jgi:glycosyltransferase involved in cell wall biosynthesis
MRRLALRRKEVYKKLDAVLWLTSFNTAVHSVGANNGCLMPNPNTFAVESNISSAATKNILCVGRFNDHVKRVDRMIDIFSRVHKEIPDATLTLVGSVDRDAPTADSKGDSINDLLQKNGLTTKNVIFAGETNDIAQYYATADLILLTSETEGFPMVLTEAMCHGLPAVCGDIPGLEDVVVDDYNGYLVPQNKADAASKRIINILTDKTLRDRLSKNALTHVKQYDAGVIADRWDYLFKTLIADRNYATALQKKLSFEVGDRTLFERRLVYEFDESMKQSVVMARSLTGEDKESVRAKTVRLTRSTMRDFAALGPKRASKKALKKVARKAVNVLGLDRQKGA